MRTAIRAARSLVTCGQGIDRRHVCDHPLRVTAAHSSTVTLSHESSTVSQESRPGPGPDAAGGGVIAFGRLGYGIAVSGVGHPSQQAGPRPPVIFGLSACRRAGTALVGRCPPGAGPPRHSPGRRGYPFKHAAPREGVRNEHHHHQHHRGSAADPQHHPGTSGPNALVAVPHSDGSRARHRVDPGRAVDHGRQCGHLDSHAARHPAPDNDRGGGDRNRLPARRGDRGAGIREAFRQARAPKPVHVDPGRLPDWDWAYGVHRHRDRLARLLVRDPVHCRQRHRGRVLGHQLGDRRDDAFAVPRAGRYLDQRLLLGRVDHGHVRVLRAPQLAAGERGLARVLPRRPGARSRDHAGAAQPS